MRYRNQQVIDRGDRFVEARSGTLWCGKSVSQFGQSDGFGGILVTKPGPEVLDLELQWKGKRVPWIVTQEVQKSLMS